MKKPKRIRRSRATPGPSKHRGEKTGAKELNPDAPSNPNEQPQATPEEIEDYASPIESWNAALQEEQDEFDAAEAQLTEEEKRERMKRLSEFIRRKQAERN